MRRFGNWIYNDGLQVIYHRLFSGYQIDVEKLTTSAKCLDMIMQVTQKTMYSREDKADFIEAIRSTVDPQANLCSWGRERGKG